MTGPRENKGPRRVRDRPIEPGTPLFRLIEAIAAEVAKRLREGQAPEAGKGRALNSRQSMLDKLGEASENP